MPALDHRAATQETKAAQAKAEQDRAAAENARDSLFFVRPDLQVSRLGTAVASANFAQIQDVRVNPFHFRKLGLAVVRTRFNRMVSDDVALFSDEFAPILLQVQDVDRSTRSGEIVMLAFEVTERGEVERS